jgi:DNA-directed RNA polymerase specialized sigma subunit
MIKNKITELSTLREMCYGLSAISNEERVQTTPNHDKIGTVLAKLDSLERKIDGLVDEYADKREKIISQIDSMDDECVYNVLFARYIEKKTFEKIATEMNYSFRQVTRIHGRALREFEKKFGNEYLGKMS